MGRRKYTSEQIISKLREVEVALAQGATVSVAARGIGVTDQTYYRWLREYGGLTVEQAKRLKEIEKGSGYRRNSRSEMGSGWAIVLSSGSDRNERTMCGPTTSWHAGLTQVNRSGF